MCGKTIRFFYRRFKTGHTQHNGNMVFLMLAIGATGVVIGFLTYGHKIIKTVGSGITALLFSGIKAIFI